MSQATVWSEDRVTTLTTLWREGLSAAQIARRLGGVTRNAVIGKVHRLGLSGRAKPSRPRRASRVSAPRAPRRARAAPVRPSRPLQLVAAAPPPPQGPGLVEDLVQLGPHTCKWPIGDPKLPGFTFCGEAAKGRYCAAHEALGVQPGTAWRADRDPVVRRALAGLI